MVHSNYLRQYLNRCVFVATCIFPYFGLVFYSLKCQCILLAVHTRKEKDREGGEGERERERDRKKTERKKEGMNE